MKKYFGTDGIRGAAFTKLSPSLAYRLGQGLKSAIGTYDVVIGYDTRQSSPLLAYMIAAGALSEGLNVSFAGVCSTPMVAYYSKEKQMMGVMVTASHNPYTDNGIKVFNKGYKTTDEEEVILESFIDNPKLTIEPFNDFKFSDDFESTYLNIYQQFKVEPSTLKIAYDSANGANYLIAPKLFNQYVKDAIQIGNTPDGLNINRGYGSTSMKRIFNFVKEHQLDIGFSFDGDGDRLLVCDQEKIYDGDEIIYVITTYLKKKGLLNKNRVVLTKMSNPGILKALKEDDIEYSLTDVGDKYVSLELTSNDYVIGGENSGHIIMRHLLHTGDGLLVAIYLLAIMAEEKKTLKELTAKIKLYPYKLVNIKDVDKAILKTSEMKTFLQEIENFLGTESLLLVRPSGTEKLIRVTVSHKSQDILDQTIEKIVSKIKKCKGEWKMSKTYALVLAAGKGTRMKVEMPKCAYPILKKPMIEYIIEKLEKTAIDEIVVVVGHKKDVLVDILGDRVKYAEQTEQLGTGHAALSASEVLADKEGVTFILPGDMPLMNIKLTDKLLRAHEEMGNDLTVVSMIFDNPKTYGRIVRDKYGSISAIIEDKDCTDDQKQIKEVNSGVYIIDNKILFKVLNKIEKNERKNEYYLTDIVSLMRKDYKIGSFVVRDAYQMMGVNDLYSVSIAERYLRDDINRGHMLGGVEMVSPNTITIGHNVIIEPGVTIYPNTTITGNSTIRAGSIIGPNTEIHNGNIDEFTEVKHSLIYNSTVGAHTIVGPFAHLRNHAVIGEYNRIGNFVEVKNSTTGAYTKAVHLSYIGDAEVGERVNFGCGSITVNFDGVNKHKTTIGDDVFIGCNVNLIAPLTIESEVFLAAGSTVTENVPKGSLSIARNQQVNKADYYHHLIKPKPKPE